MLLSVGYGQGHHAAAAALAEEFESRGWRTCTHDPCAEAYPRLFRFTQLYYHFCVRRAPWLWGVTYAQTDTADWRRHVDGVILSRCMARVRELLETEKPDVVLCTYPLYAYMLDALAEVEGLHVPYAVMVTDAIEISRPWMKSHAPLVCVPDELSAHLVRERYALSEQQVVCTGFPVRRAFFDAAAACGVPSASDIRVLYGAYKGEYQVRAEVRALLRAYSGMRITLLGGGHAAALQKALKPEVEAGRVQVLTHSGEMHSLFSEHHIYVGKAGAATVFEAYAASLPLVINYSLPGQEQGNLSLILHDECGYCAETPHELTAVVGDMLADGGARWHAIRHRMQTLQRSHGAQHVADLIEQRFLA